MNQLAKTINCNNQFLDEEWQRTVDRDEDWRKWKLNKCQGDIYSQTSVNEARIEFKSDPEQKYARTQKLSKMGHWLSINDNYQLVNSLETKFVNQESSEIRNDLGKLLNELCQGDSLKDLQTYLIKGGDNEISQNSEGKIEEEKEDSEKEEGELTIVENDVCFVEEHLHWRIKNLLLKNGLRLFRCKAQTEFLEFYRNFWNKQDEPELWTKFVNVLEKIGKREKTILPNEKNVQKNTVYEGEILIPYLIVKFERF